VGTVGVRYLMGVMRLRSRVLMSGWLGGVNGGLEAAVSESWGQGLFSFGKLLGVSAYVQRLGAFGLS